jgi:SAM-dependent methyltransferase
VPGRVYARTAPALAMSELRFLDVLALGGRLGDVRTETLGGVPYVTCAGDGWDAPEVRQVLSASSALYAVFEGDGSGLVPLTPCRTARWDDDLVTIQRYVGKTNEQFTKLLLNLAVAAGHGPAGFSGKRLTVLDPLCGRGTTLNHSVLAGHDAAGLDIDQRDVEAYVTFFSTWLKDKRAKHQVRRTGKRVTFELGSDTPRQRVVVIADDTTSVVDHLGKSSVDAAVADLPYGVQHGSRAAGRLQRRPGDLLAAAAPVWRAALRPGAGIAVAWNVKTLPREELVGIVVGAGLEVPAVPDGVDFTHRVDHAITRDVLVARRPA